MLFITDTLSYGVMINYWGWGIIHQVTLSSFNKEKLIRYLLPTLDYPIDDKIFNSY